VKTLDTTDNALASELFKRMPVSVGVGAVSLCIVVFTHAATARWQTYLPWMIAMLVVFSVRIGFARHALARLERPVWDGAARSTFSIHLRWTRISTSG